MEKERIEEEERQLRDGGVYNAVTLQTNCSLRAQEHCNDETAANKQQRENVYVHCFDGTADVFTSSVAPWFFSADSKNSIHSGATLSTPPCKFHAHNCCMCSFAVTEHDPSAFRRLRFRVAQKQTEQHVSTPSSLYRPPFPCHYSLTGLAENTQHVCPDRLYRSLMIPSSRLLSVHVTVIELRALFVALRSDVVLLPPSLHLLSCTLDDRVLADLDLTSAFACLCLHISTRTQSVFTRPHHAMVFSSSIGILYCYPAPLMLSQCMSGLSPLLSFSLLVLLVLLLLLLLLLFFCSRFTLQAALTVVRTGERSQQQQTQRWYQ